jgi:hypothetical protein
MAKGSTQAANHIQGRAKCSSIFQVIAGIVSIGGSFSGQVYNWLNFSEKKYFEIETDWSKLSKIQQTRLQTIDQMYKSVPFQKRKNLEKKVQPSFW